MDRNERARNALRGDPMNPLDPPKPTALLRERARQAKKTTARDIYAAAAQSFDAGWSMPPASMPEWWR